MGKPCSWCGLAEPSVDVPCACHPPDCRCLPCSNARVWAYLEAGADYWTPEGDREVFGDTTPLPGETTP